jgi:hypothetical protein
LSIASNIINIVVLLIQRYSFITTLFLGPFDDVITKFYCIMFQEWIVCIRIEWSSLSLRLMAVLIVTVM